MRFHIIMSTGDVMQCRSLDCSIPAHYEDVSTARAHYEEIADAEFRPMVSHTRRHTPQKRAEPAGAQALRLRQAQAIAEQERALERDFENLNANFQRFRTSPEASAPPVERGDWRAKQASDAQRNGDAHHDANPDTSVSGYHDSSVQEGDDDFVDDDSLPWELRPF
ncbi:hypothetical protein KZI27_14120 [Curtobacterium sp. TC1]|uniref:hypothetical protein n=1 Tax=Curtobacterium sp. TC1 TaxID=2862880 RepID=UPI001C9AD3EC|nr:hypothetical protein [Curtobacterium sp. TC1]QZQ54438.1 hypothetical protein KZI27_14120 [Curtobacterium sp. TC1]